MTSPERKAAVLQDNRTSVGNIVENAYGKSRVRLSKIQRHGVHHDLKELIVDILLEGEFTNTYTTGDNTGIVATDSMKNTVYVLAARNEIKDPESFAKLLAQHFIKTYDQIRKVTVVVKEEVWQRIAADGKPSPHAFFGASAEKRVAEVVAHENRLVVKGGIEDLRVVKTTDSQFTGFLRDEYTTLAETKDRIFGTAVSARWQYNNSQSDYSDCWKQLRDIVLDVFATHVSLSVQQTLHEIGQEALAKCRFIDKISITMPNQHRIPFNLQPFGLENKNEIFVTTDEPYGLISATLIRPEN